MSSSSEENEESKGTISLNYTNSDEESLLGEETYEPDLVNDQGNSSKPPYAIRLLHLQNICVTKPVILNS